MTEPIENLYFNWLCAKVLDTNTRNYVPLMEILFNTEFVWVVPADEHRIADGVELRQEFLNDEDPLGPRHRLNTRTCSIFEVLVAFSSRASFQTDIPAKEWFWEFMKNLGLDRFERITDSDVPLIEDILYTFTWRIYEPNGLGGLFPLDYTENDQRQVEIWYQFCEYLACRGLV